MLKEIPQESLMVSVAEVAEMLGCSKRHVQRLADSGRMPHPVKVGRLTRWKRDSVVAWIDQGCPASVRRGARA